MDGNIGPLSLLPETNSSEEQDVLEILNLRPNKHLKEMIEKKFGKLVTLKDIQNLKTKV